jgi:TetR/AcrR family transcriptional regulator
MYHGILDSIRRITEEGAERGMFRRNVDPKELFITISALGYFFVSNQHTLAVILGDSLQGAERAARREQHVVEVVLGYLRDLPAMMSLDVV